MQSHEPSPSPRAEFARLLLAIALAGWAAFGLGVLWASGHFFFLKALMWMVLFVGATTFLVWRSLEHQAKQGKVEAQLHAAQSRFQDLFEQFPFSIQVVRPDGFTHSVNQTWEKLFGANLSHLEGLNLLTEPALVESGVTVFFRAALAGQLIVTPAKLFDMKESWPFSSHPPGTLRWIQATMCPVKDEAGVVTEFIIVHDDVTEQKRTESSLRAAESRFRELFEQFPLGIQIMRPNGFTAAVNRAWETVFATTFADIERMNWLTYPGFQDNGVSQVYHAALEGQVMSAPPLLHDMAEFAPFSNHKPGVKLWIKGTVCPLKDDEGRVIELITVVDDVTGQMLALEARLESEARNAAIVATALDCIISIDENGFIIEWNPSAESTFGFAREDALGRLLADLIIPDRLRKKHTDGLKRYIETGEGAVIGRKIEVVAVRANGEEFPVELTITPIMVGANRIFSGFLRDLTEIKASRVALQRAHDELENRVVQRTLELRAALEQLQRKHEQLEQLETLRDTLTGMIVHDMRTPLSSMLFGVQTVSLLGTVNPAQQECLNVFALGCKDSLAVINDLLDIGKIESGAFTLFREPADAEELVSQALTRVVMLANLKHLHLAAQVEDDLPPFPADHEKVGRLLGNLLGNAIKFAPPGGTVTLGAHLSEAGSAIDFWVRDNGQGIPAEAFERIFEKFGQAEPRLGSRETSSGLGLSFCKLIVEAHGGSIRVESQPGQGSLFTATFPLASVEMRALV